MAIGPEDRKWIDALRHFMGDGSAKQNVPYYQNETGVDAFKTLELAFGLYNIKPVTKPE